MNAQERAELELLRQQQRESPLSGHHPGGGGDEKDILHRLKTLPEDEAVALIQQLRSETRGNQVSKPWEPQAGPVPVAPVWASTRPPGSSL
jgi:hypothetical protein